jgi:hypothetical protein
VNLGILKLVINDAFMGQKFDILNEGGHKIGDASIEEFGLANNLSLEFGGAVPTDYVPMTHNLEIFVRMTIPASAISVDFSKESVPGSYKYDFSDQWKTGPVVEPIDVPNITKETFDLSFSELLWQQIKNQQQVYLATKTFVNTSVFDSDWFTPDTDDSLAFDPDDEGEIDPDDASFWDSALS